MTQQEIEQLPHLLKVEEALPLLRVGRCKAYEMISQNQIPYKRIGRKVFIPKQALLEWLQRTELKEVYS